MTSPELRRGPRIRRTLVRAGFWTILATILWAGLSSIKAQQEGWMWITSTTIVLLVALTVVVFAADRNRAS